VGLSDEFCRAAQNESLDDYLVSLVARLGGLLGFRDLRDDSLSALDKEKSIRRFRELALAQGLRSVVAISLQAKEQAFGVLLLGTPDNRRFTSAELRLLLALGHQIGMAVENSYLIQQTSRRSEELHVLNEIGASSAPRCKKKNSPKKSGKNCAASSTSKTSTSPSSIRCATNFTLSWKSSAAIASRGARATPETISPSTSSERGSRF